MRRDDQSETATGYRYARDLFLSERKAAPRGRRRPDPMADIFEAQMVPILEACSGIRPVGAACSGNSGNCSVRLPRLPEA